MLRIFSRRLANAVEKIQSICPESFHSEFRDIRISQGGRGLQEDEIPAEEEDTIVWKSWDCRELFGRADCGASEIWWWSDWWTKGDKERILTKDRFTTGTSTPVPTESTSEGGSSCY